MNEIIIAAVAAAVITGIVITWILSASRARTGYLQDIQRREEVLRLVSGQLSKTRTELAGKVSALGELSATLSEKEGESRRYNTCRTRCCRTHPPGRARQDRGGAPRKREGTA